MSTKYNQRLSTNNAWAYLTNALVLILLMCQKCSTQRIEAPAEVIVDPKFSYPIANVTAPVGRDAFLTCVVQDLGPYKVAWLRVDTQTILTIQNHVITKNQRIGIANSEHKTWTMRIRDIKESDKGWYMCQINTDPMKSQMGYLDVVVPPDILDYPTSTDMVVREGSNVTLKCAATGSPEPTITWRRESGVAIELANGEEVPSIEGTDLVIPRVKRQHMGAYLCIASNGVPPSVSKRITLVVHFPPMITVQNQLIGAVEGKGVTLECQSEAYPKSINYWTRERGEIVPPGGKYSANVTEIAGYRSSMKLHINPLSLAEFGAYRCVAKNSLGDTDGTIKLYRIPPNAVNYVENFDARHKGKKRTKSSEMYHSSRAQEHSGEDTENPGKRKADLSLSAESIDSMYGTSSAVSQHPRRPRQTLSCLIPMLPLVVMLLLMRMTTSSPSSSSSSLLTTLTRQLRKIQLTLLPQTLTHV
ncbi:limbic system-associated membrane protein isoform X1 [Drosophila sulfurigaster albostrigata]|uniref:limbic system-associated membrane protein isoform X1 n=1 Tax=Drosophila sulfurigaster albostrigata TaxID=89887 RepID=UPI002D21D997|nr:limbic system-associated membrane protein isoform X1 [Drosophila sulfurigaster albostrigata]XP_062142348.1 limbic system-associated membrane protein isoform X1 [Drosophila sulfurigaster albostrigata]